MKQTIYKVLYYTDIKDNTKASFMVADDFLDLRDADVIDEIAHELENCGFCDINNSKAIANELAFHGSASVVCQMGQYEFGIEEAPLLTI